MNNLKILRTGPEPARMDREDLNVAPSPVADPVSQYARLATKLAAHPELWGTIEDVVDKVLLGRAHNLIGTVSVDLHMGKVKGPATIKGS